MPEGDYDVVFRLNLAGVREVENELNRLRELFSGISSTPGSASQTPSLNPSLLNSQLNAGVPSDVTANQSSANPTTITNDDPGFRDKLAAIVALVVPMVKDIMSGNAIGSPTSGTASGTGAPDTASVMNPGESAQTYPPNPVNNISNTVAPNPNAPSPQVATMTVSANIVNITTTQLNMIGGAPTTGGAAGIGAGGIGGGQGGNPVGGPGGVTAPNPMAGAEPSSIAPVVVAGAAMATMAPVAVSQSGAARDVDVASKAPVVTSDTAAASSAPVMVRGNRFTDMLNMIGEYYSGRRLGQDVSGFFGAVTRYEQAISNAGDLNIYGREALETQTAGAVWNASLTATGIIGGAAIGAIFGVPGIGAAIGGVTLGTVGNMVQSYENLVATGQQIDSNVLNARRMLGLLRGSPYINPENPFTVSPLDTTPGSENNAKAMSGTILSLYNLSMLRGGGLVSPDQLRDIYQSTRSVEFPMGDTQTVQDILSGLGVLKNANPLLAMNDPEIADYFMRNSIIHNERLIVDKKQSPVSWWLDQHLHGILNTLGHFAANYTPLGYAFNKASQWLIGDVETKEWTDVPYVDETQANDFGGWDKFTHDYYATLGLFGNGSNGWGDDSDIRKYLSGTGYQPSNYQELLQMALTSGSMSDVANVAKGLHISMDINDPDPRKRAAARYLMKQRAGMQWYMSSMGVAESQVSAARGEIGIAQAQGANYWDIIPLLQHQIQPLQGELQAAISQREMLVESTKGSPVSAPVANSIANLNNIINKLSAQIDALGGRLQTFMSAQGAEEFYGAGQAVAGGATTISMFAPQLSGAIGMPSDVFANYAMNRQASFNKAAALYQAWQNSNGLSIAERNELFARMEKAMGEGIDVTRNAWNYQYNLIGGGLGIEQANIYGQGVQAQLYGGPEQSYEVAQHTATLAAQQAQFSYYKLATASEAYRSQPEVQQEMQEAVRSFANAIQASVMALRDFNTNMTQASGGIHQIASGNVAVAASVGIGGSQIMPLWSQSLSTAQRTVSSAQRMVDTLVSQGVSEDNPQMIQARQQLVQAQLEEQSVAVSGANMPFPVAQREAERQTSYEMQIFGSLPGTYGNVRSAAAQHMNVIQQQIHTVEEEYQYAMQQPGLTEDEKAMLTHNKNNRIRELGLQQAQDFQTLSYGWQSRLMSAAVNAPGSFSMVEPLLAYRAAVGRGVTSPFFGANREELPFFLRQAMELSSVAGATALPSERLQNAIQGAPFIQQFATNIPQMAPGSLGPYSSVNKVTIEGPVQIQGHVDVHGNFTGTLSQKPQNQTDISPAGLTDTLRNLGIKQVSVNR